MEVILKLKEVLLLESIPTTNDLYKSLYQQDLSYSPLLHEQQQFFSVSKSQLRQAMFVVLKVYGGLNC